MSEFVQLVEYRTTRYEEMHQFLEDFRARHPQMGPRRVTVCKDRNRADGYLSIVEFDSYETAMRNNEDPATQEFAARMRELCDGPPVFHDLDVIETDIRMESGQRSRATTT